MLDIGRATILADAPDAIACLLADARLVPQAELRRRVTQLKLSRKPTPRRRSAGSRRLADAPRLLRMVQWTGLGDQLLLEQIGQEPGRLQVARALT